MKKLLFILSIASMALLNACNEKIEPAINSQITTPSTEATAKVSAVIKTQFPDASNLKVSSLDSNKVYGCEFSHKGEDHETVVSKDGKILSDYKTSKDVTLPDAIKAYLEATYKGYKLQKASQGTDANGKVSYKVQIEYNDQRITMIFDATGAVVGTFTEPKSNGGKCMVFQAKITDLPANVQSQLIGYEFIGACVKTNSDGTKTYFVLAKKDSIFYELTFDNTGKLIKTETGGQNKLEDKALKESDLPQVIKDYLKANYADWKFEKGVVIAKNGVTDSYSIVISKDKKLTLLTFDKDGKFVKALEVPTITLPKIEEKALAVGDIPVAIKTYLDKTYTGWTFTKGSVTLKDGVAELYYVYITVGTDKYHVYFDKDGKFFAAKRG
jgi:hypothetical protein